VVISQLRETNSKSGLSQVIVDYLHVKLKTEDAFFVAIGVPNRQSLTGSLQLVLTAIDVAWFGPERNLFWPPESGKERTTR